MDKKIGNDSVIIGRNAGLWLTNQDRMFVVACCDKELVTQMSPEENEVVQRVVRRAVEGMRDLDPPCPPASEGEADHWRYCLRAFCEGLEMGHIDKLMTGTIADFRKIGETMSVRIKELKATHPTAAVKGLRRVDVVRIIDNLLYNLNNHLHDPQMAQRDMINAVDMLATEPESQAPAKEGE